MTSVHASGMVVVLACSLTVVGAQARRPISSDHASSSKASRAQVEVSQLLSEGVLALATRNFATAYEKFAAAYRLAPEREVLFQLGIVASAEGKSVEAHDLLRRYLTESGSEAAAAKRAEAERILSQPHAPAGEVRLFGEAGAEVLLDDRLVGCLPLSRPLLVAAGTHKLVLSSPAGAKTTLVKTTAGRTIDARSDGSGAIALTPLQAVLPLIETQTAAPAGFPSLSTALSQAVDHEQLALFDSAALGAESLPATCWRERSCLLYLPGPDVPDLVLHAEAVTGQDEPLIRLSLLDVAAGVVSGSAESRCTACSAETLSQVCGDLLRTLLAEEQRRARGRLLVRATPDGTEVQLAGWQLGKAPLERPALTGEYDLELSARGRITNRQRVTVGADTPTVVTAELAPVPALPPPVRRVWQIQPRPRWRLSLGAGGVAATAVLLGLGSWALAVNGSCIDAPAAPVKACSSLYATTGIGAGLLVLGIAFGAGSAVALAYPGPRRPVLVY